MHCNTLATIVVAVGLIPTALAHYNFETLVVNGKSTGPYEYVRRTTNSNSPIEDVKSQNMVCNQGGLDASIMAATKTYTVAPGDEVGFLVNANLGHPGPQAVYLSRAPDGVAANQYKGDGDWFKVYSLTSGKIDPNTGIDWATFPSSQGATSFTFKLPQNLPPGDYLMRAEHIGLHGAGTFGGAQFYIGCAQLKVTGSGNGRPGPTVKFPGAYTGNEPGIKINIYWPPLTSYTAPGPVTWPNACEDHTTNLFGKPSDGDCTPLRSSRRRSPHY
ncbi:hypothetical protein PspLS_12133 [Pyricularia sp. CBS 133598]|nr:hypothetical protein PspLS_12133 [Pyricularia sp. CBS 133598]